MAESSVKPIASSVPGEKPGAEEIPRDGNAAKHPDNGRHSAASNPPVCDATVTTAAPPAKSYFGLTRSDQMVLALLVVVALTLMVWHWARLSGWGMRPVEVENLDPQTLEYRIDINTATWVEWTQLQGIGETLAERIVENRRTDGPFETIDDLRRVKGIGPKTLEKIRRYLTVGAKQKPK